MLAEAVHRVGNPHEMLDELEGDLLVLALAFGQTEGNMEHALAIERHPCRAVSLLERAPVGSGALRSTTPMLSRPRNPAAKTLCPEGSYRLNHQLKFSIKPWNACSRKRWSLRPRFRSIL